ncbi:MAG: prenyltransferase/squalene oxidase repeat-containing protein [Promethearchaeota archaeon]
MTVVRNHYQSINPHQKSQGYDEINNNPKISTQKTNYEIIEEIFTQKLLQYSSTGYFTQLFESSLQATYYALYILDAVQKLEEINQSQVLKFIMSNYDVNSQIFIDRYANRYLDTDFSQVYYPLTSVLEVNCYAFLSLGILGRLDLIDYQQAINFIWDCYNPMTSGFIGQPFDPHLDEYFKISTMDNTFYGIKTLNILMSSWAGYSQERDDLIEFINSLQITNNVNWKYGGFNNDKNSSYDSLTPILEPNLLSAFYCIKSLEIFGMEDTINHNTFYQFLDSIYISSGGYFRISQIDYGINFTNIVATSIGLELSNITGYQSIDQNAVINFIYNHRNQLGIWDGSTKVNLQELIDTFQIIRSLKNSEEISQLTPQDKTNIVDAINLYQQIDGYSLISEDYLSVNLIYSTLNSFNFFNRISELNIQELYTFIQSCFKDFGFNNILGFSGSSKLDENFVGFRSYPIEYYNLGNHNFTKETDSLYNHKFTYMALNSLQTMFKLDDFALDYDLLAIVNSIVDSQFLDNNLNNYGAFLPFATFSLGGSEYQNKNVFFEYSYYAIKSLEILLDFLNIGNVANLSFNQGALYGYITRNTFLINDVSYFNPHGVSDPATLLQHNYYMIYILKALNLFDLEKENFIDFVLENIDYTNVKNIYYCYKIKEILDLEIDYDINLTSNLVKQLYSGNASEFYTSLKKQKIDQEIFLWICEMARNNDLYIVCNYKSLVELGGVNTIMTTFSNLIFTVYGQFSSVTFECEEFGVLNLDRQIDNSYQISFRVPEDPDYYPLIKGILKIYDNNKIIGQVPISFQTYFEQQMNFFPIQNKGSTELWVNISRKFVSGFQPVNDTIIHADIFYEDSFIESRNLTRRDLKERSEFFLIYNYRNDGNYTFWLFLKDNFYPHGLFLFEYDTRSDWAPPSAPQRAVNANGMYIAIGAVFVNIILVAVVIKIGQRIRNGNIKSKKIEVDHNCGRRPQKIDYESKRKETEEKFFSY